MSARRRGGALVLAAVLAAPLAACSGDGPGEGEARLEVDGEAVVERADGDRETVDGSTDLAQGDRVTVHRGAAVMRLAGGTVLELREGVDVAADTTVVMGERPELEAGDLLVATPGSTDLEADGTTVTVDDGSARLARAFGMSVSSYDAAVQLDSAGVAAEVPALRRLSVPDLGRPAPAPRPIDYDSGDPWDRRYLGAAMALDQELGQLANEVTGTLPEGEGRSVGFFKLLLPGLEDEADFVPALLAEEREPGERLIGAAITDLGEQGSFAQRWSEVFGFRDDGAEWGIVALDQAVRSTPLLGTVQEAFNTTFEEVAQAAEPTPAAPAPSPVDSGGSTDGSTAGSGSGGGIAGGTGGSGGGGQPPPAGPAPNLPPAPPPTLPPVPEPEDQLEPVLDPVIDLVDDLLGGLLG